MRHLALVALCLTWTASAWADPPASDLRLEIRVSPAESVSGTPVKVTATFRNAGTTAIKLFESSDAHAGEMPALRFVSKGGQAFAPTPFMGQTMWSKGIQGTVREIAPGGTLAFEQEIRSFVPVGFEKTDATAVLDFLEPGAYEVRGEHVQADDTVPFHLEAFTQRREKIPGLWTGTVRSEPVPWNVVPSKEPRVVLDMPREVTAGDPWPATARITNPSDAPLRVDAALVVYAHSKMYGGGFARLRPSERPEPLAPGATATVEVPARGSIDVPLDLSRLSYAQRVDGKGDSRGLYERVPEGPFWLTVDVQGVKGERLLRGDGGMVTIRARKAGVPEGLRLGLTALSKNEVEVSLRNVGTKPVRVPTRLAYPADVYFAVTDPSGKTKSVHSITHTASDDLESLTSSNQPGDGGVAPGSWDGNRFEKPAPLSADSFRVLQPGEEVKRTIDVYPLVEGGLPHGDWSVRAYWRNLEDGRRLGVADPPAAIGALSSEAVVIRSRAW